VIEAIELTSTRRPRAADGGPVQKVSFDVYPGQVTALLGAPGAGKSTVLRLMAELEPGTGRTLFGGRPYHALRPAVREVGLALNPEAVHPGRTVQAHLQLYAAAGGVPKARIAEVLEVAGLSTQATVRCGRLDPGQRQRLSIAAALIGDPAALILDEPHALDTHGMSWFHALIRAYAAQGRTVLVAATDPDTLAGTADHVVILRRDEQDGISRVIASRSAAEVFDERRATVVQVRSPQAARLAAALETEGARLAPAGPGALQVRGLDRARIGELAHGAGICLHELSEIGHDDDVFGLRPLPRQKELLPGLNRADTVWHSGVRVVADLIEEAEIVDAPEEVPTPAAVGAQANQPAPNTASAQAPAAEEEAATTAGRWPSQGSVADPRESVTRDAAPSMAGEEQPQVSVAAPISEAVQPPQHPAAETEHRLAEGMQLAVHRAGLAEPISSAEAPQSPVAEREHRLAEGMQPVVHKAGVAEPISLAAQPPQRPVAEREHWLADGMQSAVHRADVAEPISSAEAPQSPVADAVQRAAEQITGGMQPVVGGVHGPAAEVEQVARGADAATDVVAASVGSRDSGATPGAAGSWRTQGSVAWTAAKVNRVVAPPVAREPQPEPPPAEPAAPRRSSVFGLRWGRGKQRSAPPASPAVAPANAITTPISAAAASTTATTPISAVGDALAPIGATSPVSAAGTTPAPSGTAATPTSAAVSDHPQVATAPADPGPQPAVPFTIAPAAVPDAAEDGMTPWRAVATRASQQSQQVSVAEAASGEQGASA